MIKNKKDLLEYLEADKIALGEKYSRHPRIFGNDIWKFEIVLRKYEYYKNVKTSIIGFPGKIIYTFLYHYLSNKYHFFIPPNVFGKGLSIAHKGVIIVHPNAVIGKYCRIQEMVTIGATNGNQTAAHIQDYCFLGSGAKIIGDVNIAEYVAIGANAVVVKNINVSHSTWGGVPAKQISLSDSKANICPDVFQ